MAPVAKRRKVEEVTELTFDPAARQEYLAGFHKRKVQRTKHAQEIAQKREREERVRERRELREQRKQDLEKHVAEVNALLKKQIDSSDDDARTLKDPVAPDDEDGIADEEEWDGIEEAGMVDGTDEYVDEDKYTTVTVKELDDVRDFDNASDGQSEGGEDADRRKEGTTDKVNGRRTMTSKKPLSNKPKKKKKKFRYESKMERQAERKKQKLKNSAAAKARRERS